MNQVTTNMKKQKDIVKELIKKTLTELNSTTKPQQKSRIWKIPEGYKFLVQWSNLVLLRILVKKVIDDLKSSIYPLSSSNSPLTSSNLPPSSSGNSLNSYRTPLTSYNSPLNRSLLARLESQLMDALRSTIANIEEGWKRSTTSEYLQFIGYTQGSLEEAKGDIKRMLQDKLLKSSKGSGLSDLGINLKLWNEWIRDSNNFSKIPDFSLMKNIGNYRILEEVKGRYITYEMLIELTNKTDYLMTSSPPKRRGFLFLGRMTCQCSIHPRA